MSTIRAALLREPVREALEQLILDGTYKPGEHLVETELASRLGVSRGPIREALHELSLRGWVEMRPRQGSFVHRPTRQEVDQFIHVRTLLESEAAALAAGRVTPELARLMREEIAAAEAAMRSADEQRLVDANTIFHSYIHRAAGNGVLIELIDQLDQRLRWYFAQFAMERPGKAWNEHAMLMEALIAGDRARSVALMRRHTAAIRDLYMRARDRHERGG